MTNPMTDPALFQRRSPIEFDEIPTETDERDGFQVVLRYDHEGGGPYLIDLSHRAKWSIQDMQLSRIHPCRMTLPEAPNTCRLQNGFLLLRLTESHAGLWHLFGPTLEIPSEFPYTDITDGYALLALFGGDVPAILEKVTPLDLWHSGRKPPRMFQGPAFDIPCIIAILDQSRTNALALLACGRSYGQSMVENLLKAGEEWNMRPAGEKVFADFFPNMDEKSDRPSVIV